MASVKTRPGYGYEVRYIDPATGKRPSKTFKLKKDADAYRRKVEREIEDGSHVPTAASRSVAFAADQYLAMLDRRIAEKTFRPASYKREESIMRMHVVPRWGARTLADLTENDASTFLDEIRAAGLSTSTVLAICKTTGRLLDYAKRRHWVKVNVLRDVRRWPEHRLPAPERIRTFDQDQARAVYDYFCDPRAKNITWSRPYAAMGRAIVFLAMFAGLRSGEIRGLPWSAIDFEAGTVAITQQLDHTNAVTPPKTEAGVRVVPVPDIVLKALEQYRPYAKVNALGLVFTRRSGTPVSYSALHGDIWRRALIDLGYGAADVGGWPHFHALRHFASSMMVNHMPIGDVGPILGHRDFDTTLRVYTGATLTAPAKRTAIQNMATAMLLPAPEQAA